VLQPMNFKDWFRSALTKFAKLQSPDCKDGWLHICNFILRGTHLQMVELRIVGGRHEEDSIIIPATPGTYTVEYQTISYGQDCRISRMRVFPDGLTIVLGGPLGTIDVDWGGIAVTDIDILAPSVEEHLEEYGHWFNNDVFENHSEPVGMFRWKQADTNIPYADGGFGDGTYTVYQLLRDGKVVGLEVEFISPGEKSPF